MKQILQKLFDKEMLSTSETENLMFQIAEGKHNSSQIAALLSAFQMRLITVNELIGFRNTLLNLAVKIDLSEFDTIDLCGTGGDGKDTFNISTLASFIVAGTGQKVAKHGNYGVSSVSGSSNMLEYFGYNFTNNNDVLKSQIDKAGICFLHAPLFHPAMKAVAPVRKELGFKTIFNLLGPLVNPSNPQNQLTGVYNHDILKLYGSFFAQSGKKFNVVYSSDGYDEISLTSDFYLFDKEGITNLEPEKIGLPKYNQTDLHGGKTVEESAKIFKTILEGQGTEAQNNVVCANAAYALKTVQNLNFDDAFLKAKESLSSGKALNSFKTLIDL